MAIRPDWKFRRLRVRQQAKALKAKLGPIEARLARLNKALADGTIYKRIEKQINQRGYMKLIMTNRFRASSETSDGPRWKGLKQSTLKSRKLKGMPILVQSGRLMRAAVNAVRNSYRIDNRLINWPILLKTISLHYAKYHETGKNKRRFLRNPTANELDLANKEAAILIKAEIRKVMK